MIQYQDYSPWVLQFPSCIIAIQIPARTQELLPFAIGGEGVAWLVWMPNSVPDTMLVVEMACPRAWDGRYSTTLSCHGVKASGMF